MDDRMAPSRKKWKTFFLEAGISQDLATAYASMFYTNRMRLDMLDELSKDVLRDLGIKALGDIITIIRYAKEKQTMGNRSPSPDGASTIIPGIKSSSFSEKMKSSKSNLTSVRSSVTNVKSDNKMVPQKINSLKNKPIENVNSNKTTKPITTNTISVNPANNSSKPMDTTKRLRLSERFDEFDTKRKKVEGKDTTLHTPGVKCIKVEVDTTVTSEVRCKNVGENLQTRFAPLGNHIKVEGKLEEKVRTRPAPGADLKTTPASKPVTFTVQVPSKAPTNASDVIKPEPKVTLVPARGKALNRSRHMTSIFDRLDAPSSTSVAVELLNEELSNQKNNVFKRLGIKSDKPKNISTEVVTGVLRPALLDGKHKPESVFNRLGVLKVDDDI